VRRVLPSWPSWVRLVASPSGYLLLLGLAATAAAKIAVLSGLGAGVGKAAAIGCLAADGVFAFAFAGLLALAETRPRRLAATVPVAAVYAVPMLVNASYLGVTGEQLTWTTVALGLDRFDDVLTIASDAVGRTSLAWIIPVAVVAIALPFLARRVAGPAPPQQSGRERAHAATALALLFALVFALPLGASSLAVARLSRSGVIDTWIGLVTGAGREVQAAAAPASFRGYDRSPILARAPDPATGPDLLVVIWESTRYDHTSLAGDAALAATPNLASLAARGTSVKTVRAVVPHTTKSLVSMMCGRYPLLQHALLELSADVLPDCLPAAIRRAGWRTALFQSAVGTFEHRPRLAAGLGFEAFQAQEDIGGDKLGYLASDDESLAEPFSRWLDQIGNERFFAVVLTSATHHPYSLPDRVVDRVRASGSQANTAAHRYVRLVEAQDHLLAALLEALSARGRSDRTLIVVVGDHGEGFGDKGISQHDNNFFEEGLRVPLVIAGPGVPRGEITGNASLIDLVPTLIGRLGIEPSPGLDGFDLFEAVPDRPRWFACWYDGRCYGFVLGDDKVVVVPETRSAFSFDLAADPGERRPQPLSGALASVLPALRQTLDSHRARSWSVELPALEIGAWRCPADAPCVHERR
jgi:arylsulfatase A-like enzyme